MNYLLSMLNRLCLFAAALVLLPADIAWGQSSPFAVATATPGFALFGIIPAIGYALVSLFLLLGVLLICLARRRKDRVENP